MKNKNKNSSGTSFVEFLVILTLLFVVGLLGSGMLFGHYPFGPEKELTATVNRLYVDTHNKESHYMVGTDKGVFECDNSFWLGIWNTDELYSDLVAGKTYRLTVKGNRSVNLFFQKYPGIIKVDTANQ